MKIKQSKAIKQSKFTPVKRDRDHGGKLGQGWLAKHAGLTQSLQYNYYVTTLPHYSPQIVPFKLLPSIKKRFMSQLMNLKIILTEKFLLH